MPKLDQFLQIAKAAEYLGVSPNTLRNWGRDGKVPMHRHPVNDYRLFKIADLDKLLAKIECSKKNNSDDHSSAKFIRKAK